MLDCPQLSSHLMFIPTKLAGYSGPCHYGTGEAEASRPLCVQGQSGPHRELQASQGYDREILSHKKERKEN